MQLTKGVRHDDNTIVLLSLGHLRHQDVVDWDVDELDEEPNETHDEKPNGGGLGHLHKLCAKTKGRIDGFQVSRVLVGKATMRSIANSMQLPSPNGIVYFFECSASISCPTVKN